MDVYFAGDLSCTTVNAVTRLRVGLEASCGLLGEAALPVAAKPARSMLRARARLSAALSWENWQHVRWQHKETQLSRLVNVCKPSGLRKDADSFSRVSSISEGKQIERSCEDKGLFMFA